jgi:hypothetical protein
MLWLCAAQVSNQGGHVKRRDALPNTTIAAVDGASTFDRSLYAMVQDTQQAQIDAAGEGFASRLAQMKVCEWISQFAETLAVFIRPSTAVSSPLSVPVSTCWYSTRVSMFYVGRLKPASFALCARFST